MSEIQTELLSGQGAGGGGGLTPAQQASIAQIPNKQDKDLTAVNGDIGIFQNGNTVGSGVSLANLSLGRTRLGNWNASTNTPTLPLAPISPTYKQGEYYDVTVAGTFNGINFTVGDRIVIGLDKATNQLMWELDDFGKTASQISYNNTTSGLQGDNVQDTTDEIFARLNVVENRSTGSGNAGEKYYISTPATAGVYEASKHFTITSPATIPLTLTATYQTAFEAETDPLNTTILQSGDWNFDFDFTQNNDKDFKIKISFYDNTTLLDSIEQDILAGVEKLLLQKTFPQFSFTANNKLKFKVELQSTHGQTITFYTNDQNKNLHIHTPIVIDVVNSAVQTALNLKQNIINTTVNSQAAMLALGGVVVDDIVIRSDEGNALYRLTALPTSNLSNWSKLSQSATITAFARTQYADKNGNNTNDGSQTSPKLAIQAAHDALPSDTDYKVIYVGQGNYAGGTISKDKTLVKGTGGGTRNFTTVSTTLTVSGNQCSVTDISPTGANGKIVCTGSNGELNNVNGGGATDSIEITVNGYFKINGGELTNKNIKLSGSGSLYISSFANATYSFDAGSAIGVTLFDAPNVMLSGTQPATCVVYNEYHINDVIDSTKAQPLIPGLYAFTGTPTNGLPAGVVADGSIYSFASGVYLKIVDFKSITWGVYTLTGNLQYVKDGNTLKRKQDLIPDGNNINQPRSTIASAATVNLNAATSDVINITGTTAITAFTLANGVKKTLSFSGVLTLTYNATSLILPTLANITTAAGDSCVIIGTTNGVEIVSYQRRGGQPLTLGPFIAPLNGISQASAPNVLNVNNQFTAQNGFNYIGNNNFVTINPAVPNPQTGINNNDTNKRPVGTQAPELQLVRNWYITNSETTSRVNLTPFTFLGKRYVRFAATVGGKGEAYNHRITGCLAELSGKDMMVQFPFKIYDTVIGNVYNLRISYSLDGTGTPISYGILAITVAATTANLEGVNRSLLTFSTGVSLAANSSTEDIIKRTFTMRQFIIGTLSTPPASPVANDAYFVGATPTGAWSAFPVGSIARWDSTSTAWVNHTNGYENGFIQFQFERDGGAAGTDVCDFAVGEGVKLEQGLIATNVQQEPKILQDFFNELLNTYSIPAKYIPSSPITQMLEAQITAQPTTTPGKFYATDSGRFFTVVSGVWRRYIPNTLDIGHRIELTESKEFFDALPPVNVLIANNGMYNISQYPVLFNKYGTGFGGNGTTTFAVPDWRGQFFRGADLGSGNDPDNASRTGGLGASKIGSSQSDSYRSHGHPARVSHVNNVFIGGGAYAIQANSGDFTQGSIAGPGVIASGGNETRPKNVSALMCVVATIIF